MPWGVSWCACAYPIPGAMNINPSNVIHSWPPTAKRCTNKIADTPNRVSVSSRDKTEVVLYCACVMITFGACLLICCCMKDQFSGWKLRLTTILWVQQRTLQTISKQATATTVQKLIAFLRLISTGLFNFSLRHTATIKMPKPVSHLAVVYCYTLGSSQLILL